MKMQRQHWNFTPHRNID